MVTVRLDETGGSRCICATVKNTRVRFGRLYRSVQSVDFNRIACRRSRYTVMKAPVGKNLHDMIRVFDTATKAKEGFVCLEARHACTAWLLG